MSAGLVRGVHQLTGHAPGFSGTYPQEHSIEMRNRAIRIFPALAVAFLALPAFAGSTNSANFTASSPITVGTTQLKAGTYTFQVADGGNEVEILQKGKVVGKAACHWVKLPAKAAAAEVDTDSGKVTEVSFRGNEQAVQID
jgi:hypothetical protein